MIIQKLTLDFFRNYTHADLHFSPDLNLIYGNNAQGKTNLLEAIAYLSTASSHRARYDRELIYFGVDRGFIQGELSAHGRDFTLEAALQRTGSRQLTANGVRLKNLASLSGIFQTVLFCPEDLTLIKDGAAVRRRFLDTCICQLRPKYATALTEYRKLHEHKTRILRDWGEKPSLLATLDDFNLRMAQTGSVIIQHRAHFIRLLQETTGPIHRDFSGGRETLSLQYQTVKTVTDPLSSTKEIMPQLLEHQESHRQAELETKQCLSGPHKDDLLVLLDDLPARTFASQGQTRTAALSLKLASREIFFEETEEWPVLLLDDVLSELDAERQRFVLSRIKGGQVFITCCEDSPTGHQLSGKTFKVRQGSILS
ncbi:MAG: DNA replication/repair protein RecF [Oscillospiraceae bacterium]|nr:DNA replication/repair protein RecF [Oscillospiraceae bacterium]